MLVETRLQQGASLMPQLSRDYKTLFLRLPERTRLFRMLECHRE
jgi:hypothetical protein